MELIYVLKCEKNKWYVGKTTKSIRVLIKKIKSILGKTAKMTFHFVANETFSDTKTAHNPRLESVVDNEGRVYLLEKEVALSENPDYQKFQPLYLYLPNYAKRKPI